MVEWNYIDTVFHGHHIEKLEWHKLTQQGSEWCRWMSKWPSLATPDAGWMRSRVRLSEKRKQGLFPLISCIARMVEPGRRSQSATMRKESCSDTGNQSTLQQSSFSRWLGLETLPRKTHVTIRLVKPPTVFSAASGCIIHILFSLQHPQPVQIRLQPT